MQQTNQKNIWLFDIDGVLTNPQKKIVPDNLVKKISSLIKSGDSVAFVTGRSFGWTVENVINKLKPELNEHHFKKVFISAEKGGVWSQYFDSKWAVHIDKKLAPPKNLTEKVSKLVADKFSKTMFLDKKETMISIEMLNDISINTFKDDQQKLDEILRKYLLGFKLSDGFEIDSGLIATDIQHRNSGKDLGVARVIDWIKRQNTSFGHFFAFGDSKGDIAMAQTLHEGGYDMTFIFTGQKKVLSGVKFSFPCKVYDGQYEKGTLEFLISLNLDHRT